VLILTKFNFTGSSPVPVYFVNPNDGSYQPYSIIRQYVQDPVFNPTLTVDDNQLQFTDPTTHATQSDPYAGNVWVGWSTDETAPTGIYAVPSSPGWNPDSIQMVSSSNGGQSFTSSTLVS